MATRRLDQYLNNWPLRLQEAEGFVKPQAWLAKPENADQQGERADARQ
jgi:hypothetical protein